MTDQETVRASGEATVGEQGNVLTETGSHDSRRGLQHLGHTGSTLGSLVADDDDSLLALLDLAALERLDEGVLVVVDASLTLEHETLLTGDLTDGAAGSQLSAQDLNVTGGLDGVAEGADDLLVLGEPVGPGLDVLLHGLTGDSDAAAVDQALLQEEPKQGRGTTNGHHVGHDVLATGLQVGQEGSAVADLLEVVDGQLDANGVGNGDQVQNGVGATTKDVDDNHGVLESLSREDVARADVLSHDGLDGLTDALALLDLVDVGSRNTTAGRQGHTHGLNGGGHGVGGVHATASTLSRAGVADNVVALVLGDLAGNVLSVGLEGVDQIDLGAGLAASGGNGTTVHHDTGSVDTSHSNQDTGHVLVATGQGDVGVVPLTAHDGLDTVGDDLSALQGVSHTSRTHGDTIRDTNGVEPVGDQTGFPHGLFHDGRQVHQVHVTGISLVPDGGDTDLGLLHVGIVETGGVQHGLRGTLRLGLCDEFGDLVEVAAVLGSQGSGRAEKATGILVSAIVPFSIVTSQSIAMGGTRTHIGWMVLDSFEQELRELWPAAESGKPWWLTQLLNRFAKESACWTRTTETLYSLRIGPQRDSGAVRPSLR